MTIKDKLLAVQADLKVPKAEYNAFAKFNYRTCEGILEAVKPLLKEHMLTLVLADKVKHIGDHNYVEATVTLQDVESADYVQATALAREAESVPGMAPAQATGAASSYARKYALNGLFAIDDAKDPDTDEHDAQVEAVKKIFPDVKQTSVIDRPPAPAGAMLATDKQIGYIKFLMSSLEYEAKEKDLLLVGVKTMADAKRTIDKLKAEIGE